MLALFPAFQCYNFVTTYFDQINDDDDDEYNSYTTLHLAYHCASSKVMTHVDPRD